MRHRNAARLSLFVTLMLSAGSGCGPELATEPPVVSGLYRADVVEAEDSCGMGGVWSSDVTVGYARDYFVELYSAPVPVRSDGERLEIPEPMQRAVPGEARASEVWRMVELSPTNARYEHAEAFGLSFCDGYRHEWSAVTLDDDAITVTREGFGCGEGDGHSRICDNSLTVEYELVTACETPCELAGDSIDGLPGAEPPHVIVGTARCDC